MSNKWVLPACFTVRPTRGAVARCVGSAGGAASARACATLATARGACLWGCKRASSSVVSSLMATRCWARAPARSLCATAACEQDREPGCQMRGSGTFRKLSCSWQLRHASSDGRTLKVSSRNATSARASCMLAAILGRADRLETV